MSFGKIQLFAKKGKYIDYVFSSFRKRDHIFVKAKSFDKKNALIGWNTYEIKIISIELLLENKNNFPEKGDYVYKYKVRGQLIGVNEKDVLPPKFCWDADGLKHEINFIFSTQNHFVLEYQIATGWFGVIAT